MSPLQPIDEPDSFASFYEASKDACLRAVLVSVRDVHRAEDATQDAFALAYERWPKLRNHPRPAAWVVRTAVNRSISVWRRFRREQALGEQQRISDGPAPPGLDPEVHDALAALPRRQREVVAFRVFLGFSVAETAHELGIAPGTVTAHLARASITLRNALGAPPGSADWAPHEKGGGST